MGFLQQDRHRTGRPAQKTASEQRQSSSSHRRIIGGIKLALALPAYQVANLVAYSNTRAARSAKIATIVSFLPIIALTTACWIALWGADVWLVLRALL
jgi:hypothetical protein